MWIKIKGSSSTYMPRKTHVAKIPHICSGCKCVIKPGQDYRKSTSVERTDNDYLLYHTEYWCLNCTSSDKEIKRQKKKDRSE